MKTKTLMKLILMILMISATAMTFNLTPETYIYAGF